MTHKNMTINQYKSVYSTIKLCEVCSGLGTNTQDTKCIKICNCPANHGVCFTRINIVKTKF